MIEMPLTETDRQLLLKRFNFVTRLGLIITIPCAISCFLFFANGIFDDRNHISYLLFSFLSFICGTFIHLLYIFLDRKIRAAIKCDLKNGLKVVLTGTYKEIDPWGWYFDIVDIDSNEVIPIRYQPMMNELGRIDRVKDHSIVTVEIAGYSGIPLSLKLADNV